LGHPGPGEWVVVSASTQMDYFAVVMVSIVVLFKLVYCIQSSLIWKL
jgi:hypothetical protein